LRLDRDDAVATVSGDDSLALGIVLLGRDKEANGVGAESVERGGGGTATRRATLAITGRPGQA
jgi:hypothetical protein